MTTALDFIQSALIAGTILLLVLQMTSILGDVNSGQVLGLAMQESVADLGSIINSDLSKIGYGAPSGMSAILSADTLGNIKFRSDLSSSTSWIDSVTYSSVATGVGNLRRLTRKVNNGTPLTLSPNFDSLTVHYYDAKGNRLAVSSLNTQAGRDSIRSLSVRIKVANSVGQSYNGATPGGTMTDINGYATAASVWDCTIAPYNLSLSK